MNKQTKNLKELFLERSPGVELPMREAKPEEKEDEKEMLACAYGKHFDDPPIKVDEKSVKCCIAIADEEIRRLDGAIAENVEKLKYAMSHDKLYDIEKYSAKIEIFLQQQSTLTGMAIRMRCLLDNDLI